MKSFSTFYRKENCNGIMEKDHTELCVEKEKNKIEKRWGEKK